MMMYRIVGIGVGDARLEYEKQTLAEAGYLADKMTDNGVRDAHIYDADGNEIPLDVALAAFLREGY